MIQSFIGLLRSFKYAFKGMAYTLKTERNIRFHISMTAFMFFFLLRYDFFVVSKTQYAILVLTCIIVLATEFLNTGIETVIDLVSPEYNRLAGIAKDTVAAAVLVSAIGSVAIGFFIMFQPEAFTKMGQYFAKHIFELVMILIVIVLDAIWILLPRREKAKNKEEKHR